MFLERPSADLTFRNTYQRPVSFVFQLPGTAFSLSCHVDSRMAGERVAVVFFFFFFVFIHLEFPYRAAIPGRAIQSSDSKRVGKGRFNGSLGHELEVFALSLFLHQEFKEGENNNINLTKIVVNVSLPKPLVDAGIYFEYLILRIIVVILINLF